MRKVNRSENYRKLAADRLFTGRALLGPEQVLVMRSDGTVEDIVPAAEAGEDIERFEGLLTPGFVNAHCHLELSHLRNTIPEHTGLVGFVTAVMATRAQADHAISAAVEAAAAAMREAGIVAVGDICNTGHTLREKEKPGLRYHNFVELTGWTPAVAAARFEKARLLEAAFAKTGDTSLAPHAPYSVSGALWDLLEPALAGSLTTMHNQETPDEDQLFRDGTGGFAGFYKRLHLHNDDFLPTGRSSLESVLPRLQGASRRILVHNTGSSARDIALARREPGQTFFCLCPNANLYIENRLPSVELFIEEGVPLLLGTDSLASNHTLDILGEIRTLRHHFPAIASETWLEAATRQGAEAFGWTDLGSFEPGKRPGVVLVSGLDRGEIGAASRASRLLL